MLAEENLSLYGEDQKHQIVFESEELEDGKEAVLPEDVWKTCE